MAHSYAVAQISVVCLATFLLMKRKPRNFKTSCDYFPIPTLANKGFDQDEEEGETGVHVSISLKKKLFA